jgi:predicted nuclease with TOPRIM domain
VRLKNKKTRKLTKEDKEKLGSLVKEYWKIKQECFENSRWKESVTKETRQRFTELEAEISSLNPDLLEFENLQRFFLDYV